jgi:hypothetical protein
MADIGDAQQTTAKAAASIIFEVLKNPAIFFLVYLVFVIPTYILPYFGSNSLLVSGLIAASGGSNPFFWMHLWCLSVVIVITWWRGYITNAAWIAIFPVIGTIFDLTPGFTWFFLLPTLMHVLAIIFGVRQSPSSDEAMLPRFQVRVIAGIVAILAGTFAVGLSIAANSAVTSRGIVVSSGQHSAPPVSPYPAPAPAPAPAQAQAPAQAPYPTPTPPAFDLTGDWSGTATSGMATFPYEWRLTQRGDQINGVVRISSNGGSSYALFNIEGTISSNSITFRGTSFINRVQGSDVSWCMPTGVLQYYDNFGAAKLEGTWGSNSINGGCPIGSGGNISLSRTTNSSPPPQVTANISGMWQGIYRNNGKTVAFTWTFDSYGCHGRSEEPNTFANPSYPKLFANLTCSVTSLYPGQTITIVKTYDGTAGVSHSVIYTGTLSSDLRQISGRWAIGAMGDGFSMSR